MKILIDQQEKLPLDFKIAGNVTQVITKHLPFGDYWCELEDGTEVPIQFERKSIGDLYGTLSHKEQIDRHKRKIEKAQAVGSQLYLIIEGCLTDILEGTRYSRVEPDPLVKRIFTFKVKYGFHPVFCRDREEMMRYMIETWEAWGRNWKKMENK